MKLGIFYTVFDGTELLPGAINQILPYVDMVLIIRQEISNTGQKISEYDSSCMSRIPINPKVWQLDFLAIPNSNIKEMERKKHDEAIQFLKNKGCTHFIMSACDHYYIPEDFLKAKIKAFDYDVTLTSMYTYFKSPEWRLDPIEEYQMPFICKIYPETKIDKKEYNGFRTDPSVRINTRSKIYCFNQFEIMMHHYSMVRSDIKRKFDSAAIFKRTEEAMKRYLDEYNNYDIKANPGVEYFGGRKIKVVPNFFNIKI